jgi:glutaredoxin
MAGVKVYGADWCHDTERTLNHLRNLNVPHDYVDIERDPEARAWVREQNGGKEKKPTVDVEGRILSQPANEELDEVLATAGIL